MTDFDAGELTREHFEAAIDDLLQGKKSDVRNFSKTSYVYRESDRSLWDIKALVILAGEIAAKRVIGSKVEKWSGSVRSGYNQTLYNCGYSILIFDVARARNLGLRDAFDPKDLNDAHKLYRDLGDFEQDYFAESALGSEAKDPVKTQSCVTRFVRNTAHVRNILSAAKGVCQSCGNQSFLMPCGGYFLEVHHKQWLRENGEDSLENMIALCPNCHRREHHGVERRYF
jgi:5-methylcytosine-specific restriction enzyme A